jgi:hypothetical protein
MSKRNQRREADRAARQLAYQLSRQQAPATAAAPAREPAEDNTKALQDLVATLEEDNYDDLSPEEIEAINRTHPWILESAAQSRAMAEDLKSELARRAQTSAAAAPSPSNIPKLIESLQAQRTRLQGDREEGPQADREEGNTLAPGSARLKPRPSCASSLNENVRAAEAFPAAVRDYSEAINSSLFSSAAAHKTLADSLHHGLNNQPEPTPEPIETPKRSATEAQISANRENAQKSTGATTPEGKATVSQNRRTHGLAGHFHVLPWENAEDFRELAHSIYEERKPESATEQRLVDSMIQHYWLKQRAIGLQDELLLASPIPTEVDGKKLSLFLRYQTTHERSYYKAEKELQNLRKTKQKEEIGFESQKRKAESHQAKVRLDNARALNLEIDTAARQVMEAPVPGNFRISFEELTKACSTAISLLVGEKHRQMEADKA